jgi:hypothetical protein
MAMAVRQSWRKIPEGLIHYNWTEEQARLTDGQASAGGRYIFRVA